MQQQSRTPSGRTRLTAAELARRLPLTLGPLPVVRVKSLPFFTWNRRLITPHVSLSARIIFQSLKPEYCCWTHFTFFCGAGNAADFDWTWAAGKPFGGLSGGPSKIKGGGAALPLISDPTHFASLCVFISLHPPCVRGKGDETGGRFNCQAAGSLSRGSCCHAAILKWPRLCGRLLSKRLREKPRNS